MELNDKKFKKNATLGVGTVWLIFMLYFSLVESLHPMVLSPVFLAFGLSIVFINKPFPFSDKVKVLRLLDFVMIAILIWVSVFYYMEQTRIITRIPHISPVQIEDKMITLFLIVFLLEAVRRVIGWNLLAFVLFFLAYCFFGKYYPGFMKFNGFSIKQFCEIMTMTTDGLFGTPLATTASFIFWFMMFGAFFAECGGGQCLIDIGMKFSNPNSGGPAKAAVLSSGLMGMVSGSAVANVSTTGVMTIPMMKKAGYEPHQAGAIESVASTGGQIMPPIMGVGAFIMAELLGIGYGEVAMAALIPALAYYLSVFILVDLIARKNVHLNPGRKVNAEDLKFDVNPIVPRLYLLIPAAILVYMVMSGQSLRRSAIVATVAVLVLNLVPGRGVSKEVLIDAFEDGIKQAANIALPTAACGIIIAACVQTGLATKFSEVVAVVGGQYLILALLITMIGCMLLGMALPTTAAYLIAVVLFVPVMLKLKLSPIVAHMFCFYFGVMAQITPPVCLASFTAAGIAGADSWKTGWTGFTYALVAFLVPFAFAYQPALLLQGSLVDIIQPTITLFAGVFGLSVTVSGFLFRPMPVWMRTVTFALAMMLIIPETITDVIGVGGLLLIVFFEKAAAKKAKAASAA
ncbi:MAG: TRAP transporter fused permease subunit [Lachnospiraceae bacterium]|nr:TRAP transporter fused permease subunit [Lachnospiraceae bacterium]